MYAVDSTNTIKMTSFTPLTRFADFYIVKAGGQGNRISGTPISSPTDQYKKPGSELPPATGRNRKRIEYLAEQVSPPNWPQ